MGGRPTTRVLTSLQELGDLSDEEVAGICVGPEATKEHDMPDDQTTQSGVTPDPSQPNRPHIPQHLLDRSQARREAVKTLASSAGSPEPADEVEESGADAEIISLHGDQTPASPADREHHPAERSASVTIGQVMDAIKQETGCDEQLARATIELWYAHNHPDKNVQRVNRGTRARVDLMRAVSSMISWVKSAMPSSPLDDISDETRERVLHVLKSELLGEGDAAIPVDPAAHLGIKDTDARLAAYRLAAEEAGTIDLDAARAVLTAVLNQMSEDRRWAKRPLNSGDVWGDEQRKAFREMVDIHLQLSYWLFYLGLRLGVPEKKLKQSSGRSQEPPGWRRTWCFAHAKRLVTSDDPLVRVATQYTWPTFERKAEEPQQQVAAEAATSAAEAGQSARTTRIVTNAATSAPKPKKAAMTPSKRADHEEARRDHPDDFRTDLDAEAEHAEATRHQRGGDERRQAPVTAHVDEASPAPTPSEGLEPGAPDTYEAYVVWLDANRPDLTTGQILDRAEEMFPA